MKVAFSTLGCRVNQYESEAMAELFIKDGYEVVDYNSVADVYVINTCTVTNMGDKKSRQMIGRAKRQNPSSIIAVVGCYSQIAPDKVSSIEGVDIVLGTRNKGDIVKSVAKVIKEKNKIIAVSEVLKNKVFEELYIEEYQDKTRAFLKIQDGCNRFCSYCLIPFARGAVCSKDPKKVIEEVKKLGAHGFKEIILSGIHIASYGLDLEGDYNLVDLLCEIEEIGNIERVRIGSIDPTFFKEGTIDKIASLKKLCPHFHLSLQSGCDQTLKRMNRPYTSQEYKQIVENLRKSIKDVSITTDVIVGFPGEDEEEFNKTYEFLKDIRLSKIHVFKYSKREGTRAYDFKNQVSAEDKEIRSDKLITLNNKLEEEFMEKFLGREMKVLFEQKYKDNKELFEGYTPNYIKVVASSERDVIGQIENTKLLEVRRDHLIGKVEN